MGTQNSFGVVINMLYVKMRHAGCYLENRCQKNHNQHGERLSILNTKNVKNLWMNNKDRGDEKCTLFAFSSTSAANLNFQLPKVVYQHA